MYMQKTIDTLKNTIKNIWNMPILSKENMQRFDNETACKNSFQELFLKDDRVMQFKTQHVSEEIYVKSIMEQLEQQGLSLENDKTYSIYYKYFDVQHDSERVCKVSGKQYFVTRYYYVGKDTQKLRQRSAQMLYTIRSFLSNCLSYTFEEFQH